MLVTLLRTMAVIVIATVRVITRTVVTVVASGIVILSAPVRVSVVMSVVTMPITACCDGHRHRNTKEHNKCYC